VGEKFKMRGGRQKNNVTYSEKVPYIQKTNVKSGGANEKGIDVVIGSMYEHHTGWGPCVCRRNTKYEVAEIDYGYLLCGRCIWK
jgi:hypothetical protein